MKGAAVLAGVTAATLAAAGLVVAVRDEDGGGGDGFGRVARDGVVRAFEAAGVGLAAFDACDQLVDHLASSVAESDGAWAFAHGGMPMEAGRMAVDDMMEMDTEGAMEAPAPASTDAMSAGDGGGKAGGVEVSDTNVQVAGVDEPDLAETDGTRLWTAANGALQVVDVTADQPEVLSSTPLELGGEPQLLLSGERLLVLSNTWGVRPMPGEAEDLMMRDVFAPETSQTNLDLYDVSADEPRLVASADFEGAMVAARGVDGTVHLVLAHQPQPLNQGQLEQLWNAPDEASASKIVQAAVEDSTPETWLPMMSATNADGSVSTRPALECTDVRATSEVSDTGMLQVLTLSMADDDLLPEGRAGVLTNAQTITATADELVVATPVWTERGPSQTQLHLFDLAPDGATYRASGEVEGGVLNQFSMSLHEGHLRVATTIQDWQRGNSESVVSVLARTGDQLDVVGEVDGLGRGEEIYSVRFLGDRGYVVTFRQVDPLYALDLSDPTAPSLEGELKITGYSAYLHPLSGDRLLGVGQEATEEGFTTGTQVSMFDVSDPSTPTRLSQVQLPNSTSEAEYDHHAVLVHDDLLALPYERWIEPTADAPEGYDAGAAVVRLGERSLEMRGTIDQADAGGDPWNRHIRRIVVVGDRLVTVSPAGVGTVDRDTLEATGFAGF